MSDTFWAVGMLAACAFLLVFFVWLDMWDQHRQQDKLEREVEELRTHYEELKGDD